MGTIYWLTLSVYKLPSHHQHQARPLGLNRGLVHWRRRRTRSFNTRTSCHISIRNSNGACGPSCTIVGEVQNIGITTGQQRIVTDPQSCDTGPGTCTHTVAVTFEASTALSHSQSSSWTVTGGTSVGVSAGINFLAQGTVETTLTASVGHAWGQETGTTITTGWSNSTSQTIVQQVGTHAMLTFTPYYTCWKGDASCGLDAAGNEIKITDMEFCQPSLKQDGGDIIGTYGVVYL